MRARQQVVSWFEQKDWKPFRFQRQAWNAYLDGQSGLIHATTGTGKTYAAWMGAIIEALAERSQTPPIATSETKVKKRTSTRRKTGPRLRVLWLTPLRALAADTLNALQAPVQDLGLPWTIETRTSDTSASTRARQRKTLPTALITTPESLSLQLTHADAADQFSDLRLVIVDEWHELLSTKRGVQTELGLARLRRWHPNLRTWGLSATLGNIDQAMRYLLGGDGNENSCPDSVPVSSVGGHGVLIEGARRKRFVVDSMIPKSIERFPWAGHMGMRQADAVVKQLDHVQSSLVFTNTRSQTEAWYQEILKRRPEWAGQVALHHGSLDRKTRSWVEDGLREGKLKCVVCTSSLDLGVDFSPVERVFQVGSPKGVARLLQRAGRSGHAPGQNSCVTCIPTHALQLIELAAARDAISQRSLEGRQPVACPLDLLAQHAVTIAVGGGFRPDDLFDEVRQTKSYQSLTRQEWNWVLEFITTGGEALRAYPDYSKVRIDDEGLYRVDDRRISLRHRLSVGTIVSDASLTVQFLKGPKLGTIEESFLSKINPGDQFIFAGRQVELVFVRDSKVWVRRAKKLGNVRIPRWMGGRMPLSSQLATAVRQKLDEAANDEFLGPEMLALKPLLRIQEKWSYIPRLGELLIERTKSRQGHHLFFYPFAGRLVHEGLAALVAYRLSRQVPITFTISVNDYGFELFSPTRALLDQVITTQLFRTEGVVEDIEACMNAAEMGKRQFREVAHIAGLVFPGYPGNRKSAHQLQASTGLLYDVFTNYDPDNLLLKQAQQEVLELQLEQTRLMSTLHALQSSLVILRDIPRFSPLGFPLMVDRLRQRISSEKLSDRIRRMQESLEKAAGPV
ncbi:ligase-associated DNA damage response DEXH box helicase [Thalassoroseus pseudoceratinae]|uniref:ligase-associated DNA damage response DEXH box helicase n=1 Tax=Thalassoroseus pseudoceratinae TaxID=2713176 RepID=UPI001420EFEA|nr:ligase-associated DNA damage response DEXH box helicase [Thalassoroseus pseudoceratinae]